MRCAVSIARGSDYYGWALPVAIFRADPAFFVVREHVIGNAIAFRVRLRLPVRCRWFMGIVIPLGDLHLDYRCADA